MKKPIRPIHGKDNNYNRVFDRTHDILNGGIDLGAMSNTNFIHVPGNVNNTHVGIQFPAVANTELAITHNLNKIPTGFITVRTGNVIIYDSGTTWTTTQIFLKCNTANAAAILMIY